MTMLLYDDELRDRLRVLAADVGSLHTVAALGFVEPDQRRLAACYATVAAESAWAFADWRQASLAEVRAAYAKASAKQALVVVLRSDNVALAPAAVVSAFVDKRTRVDFGDAQPVPRPPTQSLLVLCEGCATIAAAPSTLRRIPYWEFVP